MVLGAAFPEGGAFAIYQPLLMVRKDSCGILLGYVPQNTNFPGGIPRDRPWASRHPRRCTLAAARAGVVMGNPCAWLPMAEPGDYCPNRRHRADGEACQRNVLYLWSTGDPVVVSAVRPVAAAILPLISAATDRATPQKPI